MKACFHVHHRSTPSHPLVRSVQDCETLLAVIGTSSTGRGDRALAPAAQDNPLALAATLRLGVAVSQFAAGADEGVIGCLEKAANVFARGVAAQRMVHPPDFDVTTGLHQAVVKAEGARIHREVLRTRATDISLPARGAIEAGLLLDPALARQALSIRASVLENFLAQAFAEADVLLLPVTMKVAPRARNVSQGTASDSAAIFAQSGRACRFVNYLGLPALCLVAFATACR